MTFRDADLLWLLALVPALAGLAVWVFLRRQRAVARFGTAPGMVAGRATGLRATRAALLLGGLALVVFALAGPRYGSRTRLLRKRGVDVVVAVDFSKSMLARDVRPSRTERAKAELIRFFDELAGDRVGLVAFAGETIEFPMTTDYAAAALFLRDLGPYDMPVGGTAIGRALVASRRLLERSRPARDPGDPRAGAGPDRVVVLLTDGEDHEGDPVEAARELAEAGIRVYPVAIGSRSGEPIPTYSADGAWTGYQRDEDGKVVTTALTAEAEATLQEVARLTEGTYVRAEEGGVGMAGIREQIAKLRQAEQASRRVTVQEDRYALVLLPAFLLLVAEALLPEAWIGRRRRRPRGVPS